MTLILKTTKRKNLFWDLIENIENVTAESEDLRIPIQAEPLN